MKQRHLFLISAAVCVGLSSCSEKETRTYRIAEDQVEERVVSDQIPPEERPLRWTAPDTWIEEAPGNLQTALYRLASGGSVSVSRFSGDSGGIPANVNRWRQQIGLEPTDSPGGEIIALEAGESRAMWFEFRGDEEGIFAAIVPVDGATWFFKLSAPTSSLDAGRSSFMDLLKSIEIGEKYVPPTPPGISLSVPEGWEKQPASAMRAASFRIPSASGIDGDVSVIPLPGDGGSNFENVNRWRAQLRLPPLESDSDPAIGEIQQGQSGEYLLTPMVSKEPLFSGDRNGAITSAILRKGGFTWFFKIAGEAEMLHVHREKFEAFVRSAVIP